VVGVVVYLLVLWTSFGLVLRGLGKLREPDPPIELIARGAIAAAYTGLVVHTLAYAAFLEDPLTWTLLGAAVGLRISSSSSVSSSAARPASSSGRPASS
jgi:hypothetical protein